MTKFAGCILLLALATSSYAMSLRNAKAVAAEVDVEARMDRMLNSRKVRSLPYGGGPPADAANVAADPGAGGAMGPVDAFLDAPLDPKGGGGDSSEDIDTLIAELEAKIAELSQLPPKEVLAVEERVAQLQEQIAAKEAPAPQEQAQQEQQQQAEAAAPSPPEPAGPSGPDNSNKEDGDGNGNSGPDSGGGGGGQQEAGGQQGGQQDSGPGAPEAPATPEPVPYEPPQGNSLDQGNEDTKS